MLVDIYFRFDKVKFMFKSAFLGWEYSFFMIILYFISIYFFSLWAFFVFKSDFAPNCDTVRSCFAANFKNTFSGGIGTSMQPDDAEGKFSYISNNF